MSFDVDARTILEVTHGSHAYGLATATSDLDIKGVCIPPGAYHHGFVHSFDQQEQMVVNGHLHDRVIFALRKFARLAADSNPNIIEMLHVVDEDVRKCDATGEKLRSLRDDFLSKKAKHTFFGYAAGQLKRIKSHRAWLLDPPKAPPDRRDFGLTDDFRVSGSELGAFESLVADEVDLAMPKDLLTAFTRERGYQSAKKHWDQYQNWVKTRNPARAETEAKFGYDVKHGMHLIRLMRMCREILATGKVLVRRPDREELLAIRRGERSYEGLVDEAERLEVECEGLYVTSSLRNEPDRVMLDEQVCLMTEAYLREHG